MDSGGGGNADEAVGISHAPALQRDALHADDEGSGIKFSFEFGCGHEKTKLPVLKSLINCTLTRFRAKSTSIGDT